MLIKAYIFNKLLSTLEYKHRHCWQQYFQEYQFDIKQIKGKRNYLADFLSREANRQDGSIIQSDESPNHDRNGDS